MTVTSKHVDLGKRLQEEKEFSKEIRLVIFKQSERFTNPSLSHLTDDSYTFKAN